MKPLYRARHGKKRLWYYGLRIVQLVGLAVLIGLCLSVYVLGAIFAGSYTGEHWVLAGGVSVALAIAGAFSAGYFLMLLEHLAKEGKR